MRLDPAFILARLQKLPDQLALLLLLVLSLASSSVLALPEVSLPRTGLTAEYVALLVNDADPLSRQVGEYYQKARGIPARNVIHLSFPAGRSSLATDDFLRLKAEIDRLTPAHVQAYAVAWTSPYRVGCMSITSALAFGFDEAYCAETCRPTKPSPYFNSPSLYPAKDLKMRPSMMLAGKDFAQVKALIDRGIAADRTYPKGRAYLLNTPDKERSVRAVHFEQTKKDLHGVFSVKVLHADAISNRKDVLFYFTGLPFVPQLETLHFLPGALADHLTSLGGQLTDSTQMSSLRWLEAGATATYGTVVEPCNYVQKFPFPGIAMFYYANGASAIEAYWKSVAWPGQGVFIGEPLSRPFAPRLLKSHPDKYELRLFSPQENQLNAEISDSKNGPFNLIGQKPLQRGLNVIEFGVSDSLNGYLRLRW